MPTEIYDWIDRRAEKHKITRSECVYRLVNVARKSLAPKPEAKIGWTVNAAWTGIILSSAVVALSLEGFIRLIINT